MHHPKVQAVQAVDGHVLVVTFDNNQRRRYNVAPLLEREMFAPLRNLALFKAARVESGGYAVVWSDAIDISEHELWTHGQPVAD